MESSSNTYRWGDVSSALLPTPLKDKAASLRRAYNSELIYSRQHRQGNILEDYLFSYQNALTTLYPLKSYSQPSDWKFSASGDLESPLKSLVTHNVPQDRLPDFQSLSRNYSRMLANESDDHRICPSVAPLPELQSEDGADSQLPAFDSLADPTASEFLREDLFTTDYLSSPLDASTGTDSPSSSLFSSPIMESMDSDDSGWRNAGGNIDSITQPMANNLSSVLQSKRSASVAGRSSLNSTAKNFTNSLPAIVSVSDSTYGSLYSPQRPPSFQPGIAMSPTPTRTAYTSSSMKVANGTRPYITLNDIVPLDAPTRPRRYFPPSASSNSPKSAENQKRAHAEAFNGDGHDETSKDDELSDALSEGLDATESEKLARKRRRSTLAARKSRRRKLEYQLMLEAKVEDLEKRREKWRTRCAILQDILKSRDADFKFEEED
ncbi:hypothetical protein J3R30DRAFT_3700293 [Lentinula aciculospora]|uniref:BZIP domain-containing protein n=1 Tax=Lentinula aciculospora TaxID=153920 RepID=A0A9W9AFS9_9AGAR|nr:hypothetical protein J3R30DRAFT_3700293 [Lentinula aciculospora]